MSWRPPKEIIDRYADVLINFALNGGGGIEPGDVVHLRVSDFAKDMYAALHEAVIRAGGNTISGFSPSVEEGINTRRTFFELANEDQLEFCPEPYYRGLVETIDHSVAIIGQTDPHALKGVDSSKIMRNQEANKIYRKLRENKENAGDYTWTLALYGTPAMAEEAGMSMEEYWDQIINACFLDEEDPIARWREVYTQINETIEALNSLDIDRLHVEGEDVDLRITLGERRQFVGGSGRNIPSFEIFTSPDWRGTEGWIRFDQPLYRYGNLITGIELRFEDGRVVEASAEENEQVLLDMIDTEGADKVGEFSLTDADFSRISRFMATTLYDENTAGQNGEGNTHIALGSSYHDCFDGDPADKDDEFWEELGFNASSVHTDIVSTTRRRVTATLADGSEVVIYEDGHFTV